MNSIGKAVVHRTDTRKHTQDFAEILSQIDVPLAKAGQELQAAWREETTGKCVSVNQYAGSDWCWWAAGVCKSSVWNEQVRSWRVHVSACVSRWSGRWSWVKSKMFGFHFTDGQKKKYIVLMCKEKAGTAYFGKLSHRLLTIIIWKDQVIIRFCWCCYIWDWGSKHTETY